MFNGWINLESYHEKCSRHELFLDTYLSSFISKVDLRCQKNFTLFEKKVIDVQLVRVSPLNLLKKAFKLEVWSRRYDLNFLFENEEMNQTISRVLRFQRGTQPFENCSQMY